MEINNNRTKMGSADPLSRSEIVAIEDLESDFLPLRIGEEILRLEIKEIRKLSNANRADNLPGVDYKYLIESTDGKLLTVNSWVLWKKIAGALRDAGTVNAVLQLKHTAREEYTVKALSK